MDKLDVILEIVKDNRSSVKEIARDVSEMKLDVERNKDGLDEHMTQTKLVRNQVELVEKHMDIRLEKLEEKHTFSYFMKMVIGLSTGITAITGAIYGIVRLIDKYLA